MIDKKNKIRSLNEENENEKAYRKIAFSVTGRKEKSSGYSLEEKTDEINRILVFLHQEPLGSLNGRDPFELLGDERNISRREVELTEDWYKNAVGPYLCETPEGRFTAAIPKSGGYVFYDSEKGKNVKINKKNSKKLSSKAYCFYIPLPEGKLSVKDVFGYIIKSLSVWDFFGVAGASAFAAVIAMTVPSMTKLIFSGLIPSESFNLILPVFALLVLSILSNYIISAVRSLSVNVVNVRAGSALQSAAMARVMAMPVSFFRDYSPGEIVSRLSGMDMLTSSAVNTVISSGLTGVFSIVYIFQINKFAPSLVVPATAVLALQTMLSILCVVLNAKRMNIKMQKNGKLSGLTLSIFRGIQKIRFTGAEKRIFAKWANQYGEIAEIDYTPPRILLYSSALSALISSLGFAVIYYAAAASGVSQADYMAFNSSYGMVSGAFSAFVGIAETVARFGPILNMIKPILETEPETDSGKKIVETLGGKITVSHVSFRYREEGPDILDDISLEINPGEYVGIVGSTGSGKSTLMRIMLGFEKPRKGAIYYDDRDMASLSIRSLRRKIGTVLQHGQLFPGSIFNNLMISNPELTEEEAWEALEMAFLADDVRKMPMKLNTIFSEGNGGISGGQKQRLLIARALVGKPKIIFMDEATSALDNIAQANTVKALDSLNCTRVVIAHRLSTIRNCSRIIMLDSGKIAEEGTYEELISKNGKFAALVERQRLENS